MKVCTQLITYDAGDFSLAESIAEFESDGRVWVAVTRDVSHRNGLPMVRLVGEPEAVIAVLVDGWSLTKDEAVALLEG